MTVAAPAPIIAGQGGEFGSAGIGRRGVLTRTDPLVEQDPLAARFRPAPRVCA